MLTHRVLFVYFWLIKLIPFRCADLLQLSEGNQKDNASKWRGKCGEDISMVNSATDDATTDRHWVTSKWSLIQLIKMYTFNYSLCVQAIAKDLKIKHTTSRNW